MVSHILAWSISAVTIALILIRPKKIPEAVWACAGAVLLVLCGTLPPAGALSAIRKGVDVYLFLTGMMLLAELARREGFFDWIATVAVRAAKGSRTRLFAVVYGVGIVVTTFLSNDATAVVLTPAVLAATRKARATPLPYLLICAFIANAASFVLPISNPANLVLYGSKMPPLLQWLKSFGLPSVVSIAATFLVLWLLARNDLNGGMESDVEQPELSPAGHRAAYGIAFTAIALLGASAFNLDLGLPTFVSALLATLFVSLKDHDAPLGIVKDVSWSVLPLVAGLFVLVEALNGAGALDLTRTALKQAQQLAPLLGGLAASFAEALLSNVMNNLPVGLITGSALQGAQVPGALRDALLIGVDLGPNLSVTGSLATILWLVALRRDGEEITAWQFLKYGLLVMPIALLASVAVLAVTAK